jgi:methyl-accepting chemotaxis protein
MFDSLSIAIQEAGLNAAEVLLLGTQMEKGKNEIVKMMENLSAISEESSAGAEQIVASVETQVTSINSINSFSKDLGKLAIHLDDLVKNFKIE